MDTTGKNEQIEKETLGLVLEEFTQEQKTTNQSIGDLITAVNAIGSKVDDFKKELDKPKAVSVMTDTMPIQQIMQKGLTDVKSLCCFGPIFINGAFITAITRKRLKWNRLRMIG